MHSDWVAQALKFAGISQAELGRRLAQELPHHRDGRDIVNKIIKGRRELFASEMIAISRITGYPIEGASAAKGEADPTPPRPASDDMTLIRLAGSHHLTRVLAPASGPSARIVGTFDEGALLEGFRAAFLSAGVPPEVADRLARGWIESARAKSKGAHSPPSGHQ